MTNTTTTNQNSTTIATSILADYVPREDYEALQNQLITIQKNAATILIQRHMNKLSKSAYYEALKDTRKEILSKATDIDTEKLDRITAQQITLLANYFYRAGLMDTYECNGAFQDVADVIGLYDTSMEQIAEEHFGILDA